MFNGIKERIGNYFAQKRIKEMKETISMMQIEKEDQIWNNIMNIGNMADFSIGDLKSIRDTAYIYYHKNPMVKQAVRLTTEFVFAGGVPVPSSNNNKIKEAINEVWLNEQNQVEMFSYQAQIEKSNDLLINGEIFLVLFEDKDTKTIEIGSIDAGEIVEIITDENNKKKVLFYKRKYYHNEFDWTLGSYKTGEVKTAYYRDWKNDSEELPEGLTEDKISEGKIKHIKINSIRSKRGISEVFVILSWARAHKSMCEDLATWSKAKSIFAWKKKMSKARKSQIDTMKAIYNQKSDLSNPSPATASTIIENDAVENTPIDYKSGASDWASDIRQMVLPIASGSGYSEQYFGNPSTANLAIGEKLELPLLKKIEGWQKFWEEQYIEIIKYCLLQRGIIDSISQNEIDDKEFIIDVDFPPIIIFDIQKYMTALEIGKRIGGIDNEEVMYKTLSTLGVNNIPDVIEKMKIEREKNPPVVNPIINPIQNQANETMLNLVYELSKAIKESENGNK